VLVASAESSDLFYKSNASVFKKDKGWEQVLLKFRLPLNFPDSLLKFYVWNKGNSDIYFDDMAIKEYDR
jgi:hypothetical protein